MLPERVLLLGGNGRLGSHLKPELESRYILNTPNRDTVDVTDLDQLRRFVRKYKPQIIINCLMANVSVDQAENSDKQELVMKVNAEVPGVLAQEAATLNAHNIYYSSDFVFGGNTDGRLFKESDLVKPLNFYGISKAIAEYNTLSFCPTSTVLRTAFPYYLDPYFSGRHQLGVFNQMLDEGKPISAVSDKVYTPTSISDLVRGTLTVLKDPEYGVFHLAGEPTTTLQFVMTLAHLKSNLPLEKIAALIKPVSFEEYAKARIAKEPNHSGLDTTRFKERYNFSFHSHEEMIWEFVKKIRPFVNPEELEIL
jgi:dTDP-4-dehydrorhamnose reductase